MVQFGNLNPDGDYEPIRRIPQNAIALCPFAIIDMSHYRANGKCRCDDPRHREMMKEEWEYTDEDFREVGLIQ